MQPGLISTRDSKT